MTSVPAATAVKFHPSLEHVQQLLVQQEELWQQAQARKRFLKQQQQRRRQTEQNDQDADTEETASSMSTLDHVMVENSVEFKLQDDLSRSDTAQALREMTMATIEYCTHAESLVPLATNEELRQRHEESGVAQWYVMRCPYLPDAQKSGTDLLLVETEPNVFSIHPNEDDEPDPTRFMGHGPLKVLKFLQDYFETHPDLQEKMAAVEVDLPMEPAAYTGHRLRRQAQNKQLWHLEQQQQEHQDEEEFHRLGRQILEEDEPSEPLILPLQVPQPNDPRFAEQTNLQTIRAPEAWNVLYNYQQQYGGWWPNHNGVDNGDNPDDEIVIHLADTGLQADHPDVQGTMVGFFVVG